MSMPDLGLGHSEQFPPFDNRAESRLSLAKRAGRLHSFPLSALCDVTVGVDEVHDFNLHRVESQPSILLTALAPEAAESDLEPSAEEAGSVRMNLPTGLDL